MKEEILKAYDKKFGNYDVSGINWLSDGDIYDDIKQFISDVIDSAYSEGRTDTFYECSEKLEEITNLFKSKL